jgi:hypothetical protein
MTTHYHPQAWHVTSAEKYALIEADGHLRPISLYIQPPERPVVWFSKDQYVDRSCRRVFITGSTYQVLSVQETRQLGGGLIRLGIDARKLLSGNTLRAGAKITWPKWVAIRQARVKLQSDPENWLGSLKPIPLADMTIDVMNDSGVWIRVQDGGK